MTDNNDPWASYQTAFTGGRLPFFPFKDIAHGQEIVLKLTSDVEHKSAGFQGAHSLFEFDAISNDQPFRVCVSGIRLAHAIAGCRPTNGTKLVLTPTGTGRDRLWSAVIA